MGRYLVKINELNEKNNYIYETILQINESIKNIEHAKDNVKWVGLSQDKFMNKYSEYVESLNKMSKDLETCLNITKSFYNNYTIGYQDIKRDLKNVLSDLEKKYE